MSGAGPVREQRGWGRAVGGVDRLPGKHHNLDTW